ncbi:unnamed protein product [Musa acuminata subsp. malaccensis]|uniref:(wild Malaysian banana) hypothetical protein n=1 Tax=Musa acuminata subsp. malaccensis TaxID=214687 RepID=A0A804KYU9_MUSAM|nr:unnamed protein product [Musa acuminata subsp. malaccensis]
MLSLLTVGLLILIISDLLFKVCLLTFHLCAPPLLSLDEEVVWLLGSGQGCRDRKAPCFRHPTRLASQVEEAEDFSWAADESLREEGSCHNEGGADQEGGSSVVGYVRPRRRGDGGRDRRGAQRKDRGSTQWIKPWRCMETDAGEHP